MLTIPIWGADHPYMGGHMSLYPYRGRGAALCCRVTTRLGSGQAQKDFDEAVLKTQDRREAPGGQDQIRPKGQPEGA